MRDDTQGTSRSSNAGIVFHNNRACFCIARIVVSQERRATFFKQIGIGRDGTLLHGMKEARDIVVVEHDTGHDVLDRSGHLVLTRYPFEIFAGSRLEVGSEGSEAGPGDLFLVEDVLYQGRFGIVFREETGL